MANEETNLPGADSIPDLGPLHLLGLPRHPKLDAMHFVDDPHSRMPRAAPCLNDSYYMLCEARYALIEGFKQVRENRAKEPPDEWHAAFFGQFYGADVTLRLYAAGEHLANAIIEILAIDGNALSSFRKNGPTSLQSALAKFLASKFPGDPISSVVKALGESKDWKRSIHYRNDWVHEQAPQVRGLGIQFKRDKEYWREGKDSNGTWQEIGFGGQNAPDLSVDELLEFAHRATCNFTETLASIAENYKEQVLAHPPK